MTVDGIEVRTDFPSGNAAAVEIGASPGHVDVSFMPHPHGGPETLWFHLRVEVDEAYVGQTLRLTLGNPANMLGGNAPRRMRPVVRYGHADEWSRLGTARVGARPDGRERVTWEIGIASRAVEVAYCYPYGPAEVAALPEYWQRDAIGVSQGGRVIERLSNSYGERESEGPGLYLIARQHAAETPGSWVLDGFLRAVAEMGDGAPLVWAVPLTNIDGVEQGDYGKDNFPYDLNRAWGQPPMRHETLVMQRDIARWRERCRPALAIDFHAPGACEAEGAYAYLPKPDAFPEALAAVGRITEIVEEALTPSLAADPFSRSVSYASRWETPTFTSYMSSLDIPAFTLETPYALIGERELTIDLYRDIGQRMAEGIAPAIR